MAKKRKHTKKTTIFIMLNTMKIFVGLKTQTYVINKTIFNNEEKLL